jgi:integrase
MKRTVKFDLFPQKSDCKPIRARVSYGGKRVDLRLGYSIEPEKWDNASMRVLPGFKNKYKQSANEINKAILLCQEQIESIFTRFELLEKHMPSPEELKSAFNEINGKKQAEPESKSFYQIYNEFTCAMGAQNEWEKATYVKFSSIKNHLQKFDENLSFETLNDEKMQSFLNYMQDTAGLRNTTIAKNFGFVKWFLRWAYSKDYYQGKVHETFKPKLKGTDGNSKEVIHLTWDELISLLNFKFPKNKPSFPLVRDVFCFCCFTGLRYSDVAKLKRSDVKTSYITVVTKKTVDGIKIELNKYSKSILAKYSNIVFPDDKVLPVISNQQMNDHLKIMGKVAGITDPQRIVYFKKKERIEEVYPKYKLLTTHCGRRTFIVNSLYLGIPAEVIMKWTGHSDYKAMKPYIKIVDELKASEMNKFNKFGEVKKNNKKSKTQK